MPSKTPKQHRAMEAAAHGNSRLGIPKKVAKEFVAADKGKAFRGKNSKRGIGAAIGRSLGHGRKG
jgi:hypothetical protein